MGKKLKLVCIFLDKEERERDKKRVVESVRGYLTKPNHAQKSGVVQGQESLSDSSCFFFPGGANLHFPLGGVFGHTLIIGMSLGVLGLWVVLQIDRRSFVFKHARKPNEYSTFCRSRLFSQDSKGKGEGAAIY